jgi:hypothetical protein
MFDWLMTDALAAGAEASAATLAVTLGCAFVFGLIVAGVYVITQRNHRTELASLATTLLLLTILIAMVTLIIGNNVARAFSLVGALAIVRFRTVVEDTRDTAFVIFAVIVGMSIGSGYVLVSVIGVPVVAVAAALANLGRRPRAVSSPEFSLSVRLGLGADPAKLLGPTLDSHLAQVRLQSVTTARQGAALDVAYVVRFRDPAADPIAFVGVLNKVEGVQSVEMRRYVG